MLRRFLDALFTAIVLILFIPTILILVSWNAIPGDSLYPLKSSLENITLAILSGTPLVPKVSIKFTDRRLTEATALLDKKGSTVGYDLLVAEAKQTQNYISEKNDAQSAVEFSKNIDGYKEQIEKKKADVKAEVATSQSQTNSTITPITTPIPVKTPLAKQPVAVNVPRESVSQITGQTVVVNVPQTVVIKNEDPAEVLQKLEDTEAELDKIKERVQKDLPEKGNSGKDEQPRDKGH